ncbi:DUF4232 domain-containing protein [Streptomyces sp. APSN-46.1]|uniref:DUF4232 domain-containing protein n=1 Tax=Streptomyces sp. APSN-46.1 TaxID=2929049 RepID=UPI001FB4CFF2|nr:DUF4232 domain-containing protein [Streptomyces sp. APSN-46.1]MCJ1677328.1 DUF4232 domain-containing protein [Streptomyces sp. APSN-46.1]
MIAERWVRGLVGGVIVLGAVAGCDVPPPPEAAPGPTAPTRAAGPGRAAKPSAPAGAPRTASREPCPAGGVRLREGGGDAAMGLRVAGVELVNCGAEPYVLEGYPEIRLLDKDGAPVEVAVGTGTNGVTTAVPSVEASPQRMSLRPGGEASTTLVWRNTVTDVTVPAVEGWEVEIVPRPGAPRVRLRLTQPIDLGNTGKLGFGPWIERGTR